ncbi:MAG: iron chelate uptake ABC transporter family permease subunit [Chloroflexi bacterium]|nr:iron chelate uptake ABC transporter family permease subunit [Chloroflexota bacterium]
MLLGSIILAAAFGSVAISPLWLGEMVINKTRLWHFTSVWQPSHEVIFFQIRLPRVLGAVMVGAALASAGVLFQGLLRNPMADPFVLGISGGAVLGATLAMSLGSVLSLYGFGLVPLFAFVGALVTMGIVYQLSRIGGRTPIVTLLLAGFAMSSLLGYTASLLLLLNAQMQLKLRVFYSWILGGISVNQWNQIGIVALLILAAILLAYPFAYTLNALALGEEAATHLGIAVERDKMLIIALGCLLTAAAVSISGLVGFVGLVVPHGVRLVMGPDHRLLLPASALSGGSFLVVADLLSRTLLSPTEIPVGIVTAMVGGPFFLYLLRRTKREYRF